MEQNFTETWTGVRWLHKNHKLTYQIMGGLFLVLIGIWIGGFIFASDNGYAGNIYSEIVGIVATVVVLDRLNERRQIKELKERLVMQVRSQSNETAKSAVDELRYRGWLRREGGLLKRADLVGANLQEADLDDANLQRANLQAANLQRANLQAANVQGANLMFAKLESVDLWDANLQGAILMFAKLQGVDFGGANLRGAHLGFANLQGADLRKANLQGTDLENAEFDETSILPDRSMWTPDTDMKRFTDPQHPQYWRSDNPQSPAYRGKSEGE